MGGVEAREADRGAPQRPHCLLGPLHDGSVVHADRHTLADGGRVAVAGDAEIPAGAPVVDFLQRECAAQEVLY